MTRRIERLAVVLLVVFGVLALGASTGLSPLPRGSVGFWVWPLHVVCLALGVAGGALTVARAREVDVERWRIVDDGTLTSGERELAHREAEGEVKRAGMVLLLAPIAVGGFLAYQLRQPELVGASDFLIVSPGIGFGLGLLLGRRLFPERRDLAGLDSRG